LSRVGGVRIAVSLASSYRIVAGTCNPFLANTKVVLLPARFLEVLTLIGSEKVAVSVADVDVHRMVAPDGKGAVGVSR
jgi:hypothetical protein